MPVKQDPIVGRYVYVPYEGMEYRVFYEEAGDGIPLVCLHTAGTDSREWRHQLSDPEINGRFRVIALDLPRHGKSIPPAGFHGFPHGGVPVDGEVLFGVRDCVL